MKGSPLGQVYLTCSATDGCAPPYSYTATSGVFQLKLRNLRTALCGIGLLAMAACDTAYPVTVIGENGMTFRGSATNTFLYGGSFQATNGQAVCVGTYDKFADISTVSFPIQCNNGLSGIGTAFFQSETAGSGFVTMSDGSRWQFLFGRGALAL